MLTSTNEAVTTAQPAGKICPTCSLPGPTDGVLCRRCFTDLRHTPIVEVEHPTTRSGLQGALERAWDASLDHPWFSGAAIALAALAVLFYVQVIHPAGPLPAPQSGSSLSVSADSETWPLVHGDLAASRTTSAPALLDGEIAWTRQFDSPVAVPIVTGKSALYVALEDGSLFALALEDGRELWSLHVSGRLDAAPTIAGDLLFVPFRGGRIVALEGDTGRERWSTTVRGPVYSSLVVSDGFVIAAASTALVGLDATSGTVLWEQETDGEFVTVAPIVTEDRIAVATNDRLQIFDRRTGERRYFFNLPDPTWLAGSTGSVTAMSGRWLYTFDKDETNPWWEPVRGGWANLYVFGLAPEVPLPAFRWRARIDRDALGPVVQDERVIVAWPSGEIHAYDSVTGEVLWTRDGNPIAGAPVLTSDGLLVIEPGGVAVLDEVTGNELSRRDFSEIELREGPPTAQGLVLVTASDAVVLMR